MCFDEGQYFADEVFSHEFDELRGLGDPLGEAVLDFALLDDLSSLLEEYLHAADAFFEIIAGEIGVYQAPQGVDDPDAGVLLVDRDGSLKAADRLFVLSLANVDVSDVGQGVGSVQMLVALHVLIAAVDMADGSFKKFLSFLMFFVEKVHLPDFVEGL
jgi:hypothetical protein